jgi:hypothetical protein
VCTPRAGIRHGRSFAFFEVARRPRLWLSDHPGLRILYLHLMLLGFVSTGPVAAARSVWHGASLRAAAGFYGAVAIVLVSLLALIWPGSRLALRAAAWGALFPVAGAAALLTDSARTRRKRPSDWREPVRR